MWKGKWDVRRKENVEEEWQLRGNKGRREGRAKGSDEKKSVRCEMNVQ